MPRSVAFVCFMTLVFSSLAVKPPTPKVEVAPDTHTFMTAVKDVDQANVQKQGTDQKALAKAQTEPALQPADTYEEDYPIDNSHMTPTQLRYKAQADYASAVARMKEEEGETVAAEAELAQHHAAVAAAKQAALARKQAVAAAQKAQQAVDAAKAKMAAAGGDASAANAEQQAAAAELKREQDALTKANAQ